MEIDFTGGAYQTFSKTLNSQECVNFISVNDPERKALRGTPGLNPWLAPGIYAEVRGSAVMSGVQYAVIGNTVYRIPKNGAASALPGRLGTDEGALPECCMAENGSQLMIVDGRFGYIVEAAEVNKIDDDAFPSSPETVTYQDGYFIITINGSGRCYISDLLDGASWDGTMFFNAEARADDSLCVVSVNRNLEIFGKDTVESWYNSGATVTFDRRPGTTREFGIGAPKSAVVLDGAIYFLTNKKQVARKSGNSIQSIITPAIEYQISQYERVDDAVGMAITNIEGHTLYVLSFPSANATWAFDVITGAPFQWMSYPEPFENRWRGNCYAYFNGKHIVGDYQNGQLYELDFDTFSDNSNVIRRLRTSSTIRNEGKNIFHNQLEIFFEPGMGLVTGQGSDPMAMLQYSDDGGHTWSNEIWRGIGKIGKYKWRAVWNRLGSARQRNYRLAVSDPIKWVVIGANLEASVGTS